MADQVQAYFGPDDLVKQVESAVSPTPIRYGAIDFGGPAADVKAALDRSLSRTRRIGTSLHRSAISPSVSA